MKTYELPQLEIVSMAVATPIAAEEDTSVIVSGSSLYPPIVDN